MKRSVLPLVWTLICVLFSLICSLRVSLSARPLINADILQHPVNHTVPASQTEVTFTCQAHASAVFWVINDVLLTNLPNWDDWITIRDNYDQTLVQVTRRIDVRTQGRNGTKVVCHATGDNQSSETSDSVFLVVVDAPLSPTPHLSVINSTALSVSWDKPFSWEGFGILSYTLTVRNGTTGSIIETSVLDVSSSNTYPLQYVFGTSNVHTQCHNITMEVTASNSVGASSPGAVVGGFPIPPGEFVIPPVFKKTFTAELKPIVNVTFKPPMICWFQTGSYTLQLFDSVTREEVLPQRSSSYGGGDIAPISEVYDAGLISEREYDVLLTAETMAGAINTTRRFNTSFSPVPPQDIPQLAIVNSSAIRVQWNRSSTFQHDVDISYTLVVRNETGQVEIYEEVFNVSAGFNSYPMQHVFNTDSVDLDSCHNISFTILSTNSLGEVENPRNAVSGFPIVPADFATEPTVSVSFSSSLIPSVTVSFEYPHICWYQSGSYSMQITDRDTGEVVETKGPIMYQSSENSFIVDSISSGLVQDRLYSITVIAETFAGSVSTSANFNTSVVTAAPPTDSVTTTAVPSTGTPGGLTQGIDMSVVAGIVVVCALVLALSLSTVVVLTCLYILRKRKIKERRMRRRPLPLVTNPLYESGGPIYEEIPGEKNIRSLPRQSKSQASEYVMIEGKINGDQHTHYDVICTGGDNFESKKLQDEERVFSSSAKALGLSLPSDCVFPEAPPITPGEDPYTLMNPAGALTASIEHNGPKTSKSIDDLPSNGASSRGGHSVIRPCTSLPLVSLRINPDTVSDNGSGDNGTPEERYVRRSLLT